MPPDTVPPDLVERAVGRPREPRHRWWQDPVAQAVRGLSRPAVALPCATLGSDISLSGIRVSGIRLSGTHVSGIQVVRVEVVSIDEIRVGDSPESWRSAGFNVDDDGTCRVGAVRISLVGDDGPRRILSWSLREVRLDADRPDQIDGVPTYRSEREPCTPATHSNGVLAVDHVVLATPHHARSVSAIEAAGMRARRTRRTDSHGAPLLQTFFRAGEVIVELVGPEEPGGEGPATFFGLAHTVADLDAAAELLGPTLGAAKEAVQPGRCIATLRHRDLGMSVATALMSPEPVT